MFDSGHRTVRFLRGLVRRELSKRDLKLIRSPGILSRHPGSVLGLTFDHVVCHHLVHSPRTDFFFLQVGAYDGISGDPIHWYVENCGWNGILVEPQRHGFDRLRENYGDRDGLEFVNAAVAETRERRTLFTLADPHAADLPEWAPQIASFSIENVLKHRHQISDLEGRIVERRVDCVTMEDLVRMAGGPIDLIQIDTEGFDYEILKMIDFESVRPGIVHFEHKHLGSEDRDAALSLLMRSGYRVLVEPTDVTAYRGPDSPVQDG